MTCHQSCQACSGEVCIQHLGPCECDVVARHVDKAGREWVGTLDGMRLAEAGCQLAALVEGR